MPRSGGNTCGLGSTSYGPKCQSSERPDSFKFPHMGVTDPDEIFPCPYDANHLVRASRYPYHLVKCRENHQPLAREMKTCPFNARHILPKPEMQYHIACCRDKCIIEEDINYAFASTCELAITCTSESTREEIQKEFDLKENGETLLASENWDDELQDGSTFIWGQPKITNWGNFSNLNIYMRRIYKRQLKEQLGQEYRCAPRLPSTLPKVWGDAQKLKDNAFSMGRGKKLVQLAANFTQKQSAADWKPTVGARTVSTNRSGMGRGHSLPSGPPGHHEMIPG